MLIRRAVFERVAAGALLLIAGCVCARALPANGSATPPPGTYTNPVFDRDFPDPNLEFGHDGLHLRLIPRTRRGALLDPRAAN